MPYETEYTIAQETERRLADDLAALCKALAHPARIAIVRHLLEQERCICGRIVQILPLAQSTVSQHLKILKEAGLVRGTVEGPAICYCVDRERLGAIGQTMATLFSHGKNHENG